MERTVSPRGVLSIIPPPGYDPLVQESLSGNLHAFSLGEWNYIHTLSSERGFEYIWKHRFTSQNRNAVRKAEKSSAAVVRAGSLNDIREFYKLYLQSTKRWELRTAPQPWELYKNLYDFGCPQVQFRLAYTHGNMIDGLVAFRYNKKVFYWMSVFDENSKAYHPVNLLFKDSIQQACSEGYKHYDLGASGNLDGTRRFKESFGPGIVEIKGYLVASKLNATIYTTLFKIPLGLRAG